LPTGTGETTLKLIHGIRLSDQASPKRRSADR